MISGLRQIDGPYSQYQHSDVRYQRLVAGIVDVPRPPSFIFGPLTHEISATLYGEYCCPELGCYSIENPIIHIDGLIQCKDELLYGLNINNPRPYVEAIGADLANGRRRPAIRREGGSGVLMFGPGYAVYGHWLADFLPRLFILQRLGYGIHRLKFIVPSPLPSFVNSLLHSFGIRDDQLIPCVTQEEAVAFDHILVPTNMRLWNRFHPLYKEFAYVWLHSIRMRSYIDLGSTAARHLFVSRKGGANDSRLLENREEMEALAASKGFEVIRPDSLTFEDQVRLFSSARIIMGEYGSGLHNSIFGGPNLFVAPLRTTTPIPGFIQSGLCQVIGQEIGYLFGGTNVVSDSLYVYTVSAETFMQSYRYFQARKML